MNNTENDFVMAFDHFYTTNHIQILKSVIPYLGPHLASMLPVFVKYLELKHAISLMNKKEIIRTPNMNHCAQITSLDKISPSLVDDIYKTVHCYLTPEEDQKLQGIRNMMQAFASFQEMQQMMELMKAFAPEDANGKGMDFQSMDMQSMLSGLMNNSSSMDIMSMLNNLNL